MPFKYKGRDFTALRDYTPEFERRGVHLAGKLEWADPAWRHNFGLAEDAMPSILAAAANDAQPTMITQANAGIPAALTTLIDPEVVEIIFTPMVLQRVFGGEEKKGDWTVDAIQFPIVEPAGFVTSYGDWNNDGQS